MLTNLTVRKWIDCFRVKLGMTDGRPFQLQPYRAAQLPVNCLLSEDLFCISK